MSDTQDVYSIASELGFKTDSMEGDSSEAAATESTEAESDATNENLEAKESEGEGTEAANPVSEEEEQGAQAATEEVKEEPKLTLKEFQELNAKQVELEAKEKAFTERMQAQEKEFQEKYQEKLKTHDQFDDFLAHLSEKDPELFDILKGEFSEHRKQYSNPKISEQDQKIAALEAKLNSFTERASDQVTLTKLDSEFEKFSLTIGKEAEAAGIKVDRKVIDDMWAKGLSVNEAFFAKYGDSYAKALASKAKATTAEKKVQGRPTVATAGSVGKSNTTTQKAVPRDSFDAVKYFANKLTGNQF